MLLQAHAAASEPGVERLSQEEKINRAREYYSAGSKLIAQGDYSAADRELRKAQLILQGADVSSLQDKPQSAAAAGGKAIVREAMPAAQEGPGQADKPEEAVARYLKAAEKTPRNPDIYYNLGIEYIKAKQFERAAESFKRALQLNPRDKDSCYNLGVIYDSYIGDKRQAVSFYTRYIALADGKGDTALVRAWVRQLKGEMKDR